MARAIARTLCAACLLAPAALALMSSSHKTLDADWEEWQEIADHRPDWYDAWAAQQPNRRTRARADPQLRVAVLCSGVLKRFFLSETTSGLIAPLVAEGHRVDYFGAFSTGDFAAFNPGADNFKPEPELEEASKVAAAGQLIRDRVSQAGGRAQVVELFERERINDERSLAWLSHAKMLGKENVLRKLKPLERLWEQLERVEVNEDAKYDMVVILDDDSMWLRPFSLSQLLDRTGARENQLFSLKCGPGSTTETPAINFLTEYIFIANRTVATPWGKQYSILTSSGKGSRVWNLEGFSGNIAAASGAMSVQVGVGLIPMQRGGRLPRSNSTEMKICLHKVCEDPADLPDNVPKLNPHDFYPCCHWNDYAKTNKSIKQWWVHKRR